MLRLALAGFLVSLLVTSVFPRSVAIGVDGEQLDQDNFIYLLPAVMGVAMTIVSVMFGWLRARRAE